MPAASQAAARRRRGWCTRLSIRADNARFILLAALLLLYMLAGAAAFMLIEGPNEAVEKAAFFAFAEAFRDRYAPVVNMTELDAYLNRFADAFTAGYLRDRRPRWDYSGSFYFVGTVVSTIGFGMTTPRTTAGKALVICYGFLGCSGAILFFNLFLERIITFWALILRQLHQLSSRLLKKRRRRQQPGEMEYETATVAAAAAAPPSGADSADSLDSWKPSVYKVQFLLLCTACAIACTASAVYHPVESWTYFDSVYFCFVAFSTIGFGDLVVSQRSEYTLSVLYRLCNFCFLMLGCCCIYSFFNVTSLVLRTMLDRLIKRLDCQCTNCLKPRAKTRVLPPLRSRRNAITEKDVEEQAKDAAHEARRLKRQSFDSNYDSDRSDDSDELICMQDFLRPNKVHLVQLQKQLFETAQRARQPEDGFKGGVGPLAVVSQKFDAEPAF